MAPSAKVCILLSHCIHVIVFGMNFVYLSMNWDVAPNNIGARRDENIKEITKCDIHMPFKEIFPYKNYWVILNYVVPEKGIKSCWNHMTLTMQGGPDDVYQLKTIYELPLRETRISFAIYLATPEDMERAIQAIHYVRNCIYYSDSESYQTNIMFARDNVTFHLYFPLQLLANLNLPNNTNFLMKQPYNCEVKIQMPPIKVGKVSDEEAQHVIVGKNLAQRAANTRFILHIDRRTLLMSDMFAKVWQKLFVYSELDYVGARPTWESLSYRLTTLQSSHPFSTAKLLAIRKGHFDASTKSQMRLPSVQYENTDNRTHFKLQPFLNASLIYDKFLRDASYFIVNSNSATYDDRDGITLLESENLYLWRKGLENGVMLMMLQEYVLHNNTDAKNSGKGQYILPTMNSSLLEEYQLIFNMTRRI